jgi:uncharacterized protein (DUF433 family)
MKREDTEGMNVDQIVWADPDRVGGIPCFTGTRVPVRTLTNYLDSGESMDDFLEDFPSVAREQALALLQLGVEKASELAQEHALVA